MKTDALMNKHDCKQNHSFYNKKQQERRDLGELHNKRAMVSNQYLFVVQEYELVRTFF